MPIDISELPLVGGHVALDLVNTVTPRASIASNERHDHLVDPGALLLWGRRVGLVDEQEASAVTQVWQQDAGSAQAALAGARDVREALHLILLAAVGLGVPDASVLGPELDLLHGRWAASVGRSRLVLDSTVSSGVRLVVGMTPTLLVLDRAVDAALDLLQTGDLARLRRCPPDAGGCGWLFLDHSRNGSRRWCRMADCGTEVKARRLTQRRREARKST
jgi:predicted RNA-binding Zn ribbon-like protein